MMIGVQLLEGAALDCSVSKAIGNECIVIKTGLIRSVSNTLEVYSPSSNWNQGGHLLESMESVTQSSGYWYAIPVFYDVIEIMGETPLIAICRAIVAAKLGELVDVPQELIK